MPHTERLTARCRTERAASGRSTVCGTGLQPVHRAQVSNLCHTLPARRRLPATLTLLIGLSVSAIGCGQDADPPRDSNDHQTAATPIPFQKLPNVILITVESLRADHVHGNGYRLQTTPNIDALADEGIRYTNAHAVTSWTLPSHASLFTGLYPGAHQVTTPGHRLGDPYETLAEMLQGRGYQTAGFISGPFLRATYNLHQGFDVYDESPSSIGHRESHGDITNPQMEEAVSAYLDKQKDADQPFFLFAYLWDPHYDYIPPAPYDKTFVSPTAEPIDVSQYEISPTIHAGIRPGQLEYIVSQYDGEIACTDALLGRLWERLRSLNLWDDTVIILTADHGEEFFEHGNKGHQHKLHVESVHVPLVLKPANQGEPGRQDNRLASLIDVLPTVAQLCDTKPTGRVQGRSLLGPPRTDKQPIYFELTASGMIPSSKPNEPPVKLTERWGAVLQGKYKRIVRDVPSERLLYDVIADPAEKHPLTQRDSALATGFDEMLKGYREAMRAAAEQAGKPSEATLTPEEEARLRSLGYVQ